jgi:hypothetical protein
VSAKNTCSRDGDATYNSLLQLTNITATVRRS